MNGIPRMKTGLLVVGLLVPVTVNAAVDPFDYLVRTTYDKNITTVGEAARYVTSHTGYRLVTNYLAPRDALEISTGSIPPGSRLNRIMSVTDALLMLIGDGHCLVIDTPHKLFSFTGGESCTTNYLL